mmetsp:Transcript_10920/g.25689  ORF Transcript_10920/g.25689 Transcript_10920/m.25689 type:complete len:344 (-) Transcript_10920:206-1237(-)
MPKPPGLGSDAGWRPWVAGAAAGSAMTIIGHPFDTTKVRMQTSTRAYTSTMNCVVVTCRTEGVLALYKGLAPALLTSVMTSGLRFGVQHTFNSWLATQMTTASTASTKRHQHASFEALPAGARIMAEGGGGAACGLVLPLIFTPMELIKCKRQVLADSRISNLEIAQTVWRESGLRGLYTGHTLTVARSTLGNGALFGSFEAWQAVLHAAFGREEPEQQHGNGVHEQHDQQNRRPPRLELTLAAGVLSGWTAQLFCYPIDTAKSRMQVAVGNKGGSETAARGGPGVLAVLRSLWREGKAYRGVSAMLVRAVPVHMVYLPCYSFLLARLAHVSRSRSPESSGRS